MADAAAAAAASQPLSFPGSLYRKIDLPHYVDQFLEQGTRPSRKAFDTFRPVTVSAHAVSTCDGSALVRIGDASFIGTLTSGVCEPIPEEPNKGVAVCNLRIAPLASGEDPGPPSRLEQAISAQLQQLLPNVLDLNALVIEPGKAVRVLSIEVTAIVASGSLLASAWLTLLATLAHTELPALLYDDDAGAAIAAREASNVRIPLDLSMHMVSWVDVNGHVLYDPDAEEEKVVGHDGVKSVLINAQGDIGFLEWRDRASQDEPIARLSACLAVARRQSAVLTSLLCRS